MRIVMVADKFPPVVGGSERQAERLACELVRRDHQVIVLTGRWRPDHPRREEREGLHVERLGTLWPVTAVRGLRRYGQDVWARGLARRLTELGPQIDVAHAHIIGRGAAVAAHLGAQRGFPVIVKEASSGQDWMAQVASHHRGSWMRQRLLSDLHHVAVLNDEAERAYRALPFLRLCTHRVHNGIEIGPDLPPHDPVDPPTMVYLGRLRPEKGADVLVTAFDSIADSLPEWSLHLYGDGPEEGRIRDLIAKLGRGDRIRLMGATGEPLRELSRASLMVLPSHTEGMSNTLLEAMAVGTPAVATRVGANSEMLRDEAGWLVPPGDPTLLADALREAATSPSERRRRGDAANARVRRDYRIDAVATRYEDIYRELRSP